MAQGRKEAPNRARNHHRRWQTRRRRDSCHRQPKCEVPGVERCCAKAVPRHEPTRARQEHARLCRMAHYFGSLATRVRCDARWARSFPKVKLPLPHGRKVALHLYLQNGARADRRR